MAPTLAIMILAASLIFQLGAVILSLRLIPITGRRNAWLVISLALLLMAVRRAVLLARILNGTQESMPHLETELIGLSISILMFCGAAYIGPLFRSVRESSQAILESEQRFRTLVEASPLYYVAVNSHGTVMMVNPAMLEATGYERLEVLGQPYLEVFTPERDRAWLDAQFADLLRSERPVLQEARVRTKAGDELLVEYHGRSVYREDGSLLFFFGFGLDITERKAAERALRESEARFRTVIENTRDLVYKFNLVSMTYEYMSPAALAVTGYTAAQLIEMGPSQISGRIQKEDRRLLRRHFKNLLESAPGHQPPQLLYRWRDPAGKERWLSEFRTLIRDDEGNPAAIVGSTRDETERLAAEQGREQLQAYLQDIIDSMPTLIIGVDSHGVVSLWNREAERFTGFNATEALSRPYLEVMPLLQEHADVITHVLEEAQPLESRRFSEADSTGDMHHYDLMVYPLSADGLTGAVVRLDEVTNRVQLEEMMVQTEKMMSVGGLAAGMAHEINNPLGGILQACQNVERRTSLELKKNAQVATELGTTIETVHEYLKARGVLDFIAGIRADGSRAAKIVSDMLAYSRRSGSKFISIPAEELVDTVLRLASNDYDLKKQYDFRRVTIEKDLDLDTGDVWCDATKIEQVLLNLVKNASQAMAGEDNLEHPTITLRSRREEEYVILEVADNGPGMEEQTRRRVFEPFFTTKEVGVGTGLGLSVSYFIVTKQHHGAMSVESAPGKGARFVIKLPIREDADHGGNGSHR
jgi:PAS domain S-box-containing protein